MKRWLLAAEADKIQDLIFRSSRLAQVAGGSGLLSRFCEDMLDLLVKHYRQEGVSSNVGFEKIISGGGSFRLTFAGEDEACAQKMGADLAEAYYRATGGTLTVAKLCAYDDTDPASFKAASEEAEGDLRARKANRRGQAAAVAHMPFAALCASCGISLATKHEARLEGERPNYLCDLCAAKAAERAMIKQAPPGQERFLSRFVQALNQTDMAVELSKHIQHKDFFPRDTDQVGQYDARNYVAYIVADGNGMGVLFSKCQTPDAMRQLSAVLTDALWGALADVTAQLTPRLWRWKKEAYPDIAVMPLIVGGDDLFALLPAPYALDFAGRLCLAFEQRLQPAVKKLLSVADTELPTLSAAVVICKQNYPYALAHRQGEALLGRVKQISRAARLKHHINRSAVSFTLVRGSDVEGSHADAAARKYVVPTLCPYWVVGARPDDAPANDRSKPGSPPDLYGLDLRWLLETRCKLGGVSDAARLGVIGDLPGKRQAELRRLFTSDLPSASGPETRDTALAAWYAGWKASLNALLDRIGRRPNDRAALEEVLRMGNEKAGPHNAYFPWRLFTTRRGEPWMHGLPDVLEMWDFAQDLEYRLEAYFKEGK